jgi:hypothetical protein
MTSNFDVANIGAEPDSMRQSAEPQLDLDLHFDGGSGQPERRWSFVSLSALQMFRPVCLGWRFSASASSGPATV